MTPSAPPIPTVDIRTLGACADRKAHVLAAFDALAGGECLVVVNDHRPQGLLRHFQAQRPGQFEWSPLEEGAEVFRVEITKRAAEVGTPRGVNEALAWDHDRLDTLEQEAFAARAAGEHQRGAATYALFARGLRRHIAFEEHVLFPEFEARTGFTPEQGPTAVMRAEHRQIEALVEQIARTIGDPAASVGALRQRLHEILGAHNMKEEQVVYPGTDQAMTPEERDELVRRIQLF
jgi:uncharacterized protein (DUF2249 family)/hemerythrin-like domain-containing protein